MFSRFYNAAHYSLNQPVVCAYQAELSIAYIDQIDNVSVLCSACTKTCGFTAGKN